MKREIIKNGIAKRLFALALCFMIVSFVMVKNVQATYVYNAILEKQEKTLWCWVASARGVARGETTVTASQSQAVKALKGEVSNIGGDLEDIQLAANYFSGMSFIKTNRKLSFSEIKMCIDNGHLISTFHYRIKDGEYYPGHALYIIGYNTNDNNTEVIYCNPGDGKDYKVDYDEFCDLDWNDSSQLIYSKSVFYRFK